MEKIEQLVEKAQELLGGNADVIAASPGRVNLIGEHIDYCDGFVMPFALDRYIVIAALKNGTNQAKFSSVGMPDVTIPLGQALECDEPKWGNYLRGVIHGFFQRGLVPPGFDACLVSSVPGGAGLSSSAALECAVATLLEGLCGVTLEKKAKALLCQKAEHDFAHVPCGIMDQFASTFGEKDKLVMIDCRTGEPTMVPFENPNLTVIIANTRVHHELSDGGYALRRKHTEDALAIIGKSSWRDVTMADVEAVWETMGSPVNLRARHVVGEISRTQDAAKALAAGDFETLGRLMYESHLSLKDDFAVSCRELDIMVEIAKEIGQEGGVIGARMTGGGFGGSTVTLCESHRAQEIIETMAQEYEKRCGITAEIFSSRPSLGAHLVKIGNNGG